MEQVQGHPVAPDGRPPLHHNEGAARDLGERGERLRGGNGGGDGDRVDDKGEGHLGASGKSISKLSYIIWAQSTNSVKMDFFLTFQACITTFFKKVISFFVFLFQIDLIGQ